jgi:hypothetical protein
MTTLGLHVNPSEIALGFGPGPHGAQRSGSSPLPREPEDACLAGHLAELLQEGWDGIHDVSLDLGSLIDGWLHSDAPKRLSRVTVVRISPSIHTIQAPFDAWPVRIREVIDGGWLHVRGGVDLHGGTGPALDLSTLDRAIEHAERAGSSAICLSSVGALLDPSWETAAAEHLMRRAPSLPIVMAHEVGGRRFHERETAALLNAALL